MKQWRCSTHTRHKQRPSSVREDKAGLERVRWEALAIRWCKHVNSFGNTQLMQCLPSKLMMRHSWVNRNNQCDVPCNRHVSLDHRCCAVLFTVLVWPGGCYLVCILTLRDRYSVVLLRVLFTAWPVTSLFQQNHNTVQLCSGVFMDYNSQSLSQKDLTASTMAQLLVEKTSQTGQHLLYSAAGWD